MNENELIRKIEMIKKQCSIEEHFIWHALRGQIKIDDKATERFRAIIINSHETVTQTRDIAYRSTILVLLAKLFSYGWDFDTANKLIECIDLPSKKKIASDELSRARGIYIESQSDKTILQSCARELRLKLFDFPEVQKLIDNILSEIKIKQKNPEAKYNEKKSDFLCDEIINGLSGSENEIGLNKNSRNNIKNQNVDWSGLNTKRQNINLLAVSYEPKILIKALIVITPILLAFLVMIGWPLIDDQINRSRMRDSRFAENTEPEASRISNINTGAAGIPNSYASNNQIPNCNAPLIVCKMISHDYGPRYTNEPALNLNPAHTTDDNASKIPSKFQNDPSFLNAQQYFNGLDQKEKINIQIKLIAAGVLTSVPSKSYSKKLYEVICKYQVSHGKIQSGILSNDDMEKLNNETEELFRWWKLERIYVPTIDIKLLIPTGAGLSLSSNSADNTVIYSDYNQKIAILYKSFPSNDLSILFDKLTEEVKQKGEIIEYSVKKSSFFVFKSKDVAYGNSSYARFHLDKDRLVGFVFKWKSDGQPFYIERLVNIISSSLYAEMTHEIELDFPESKITPPMISRTSDSGFVAQRLAEERMLQDTDRPSNQLVEGYSAISLIEEMGTYKVPVTINDSIRLKFTVDSGAADVSIPADVVLVMMRTGTLSNSDFIGTKYYTLADGSTVPSKTFWIRKLTVGHQTIENVKGGMAGIEGSLLLGQSFLRRFKSWSIDNEKHTLNLQR